MVDLPPEPIAQIVSKIQNTNTHGAHKGTSLEWWYLTGPLWKGNDCSPSTGMVAGRTPDFGFQKTFFYVGQGTRTGALVHSGESRVLQKQHNYLEIAQPLALGKLTAPLVKINENWLDLLIADQSLMQLGNHALSQWALRSRNPHGEYRLSIQVDAKSFWKHGTGGYVKKTLDTGNAYVSFPYLPVQGVRRDLKTNLYESVCGSLWFDHEIGVQNVDKVQWNWFALRNSAGLAYMFYEIYPKATPGKVSPETAAQVIGEYFDLKTRNSGSLGKVELKPSDTVCLKSKNCYPQQFAIDFQHPFQKTRESLKVQSYFAEQEVLAEGSVGKTYWEGIVKFTDRMGQQGTGYVEMARD